MNIEGQTAKAVFDIRYPVTVSGNRVLKQFKKVAKISDLKVTVLNHEEPLYADKDSKLVKLLSDAYESVTGEKVSFIQQAAEHTQNARRSRFCIRSCIQNDDVRMHNADESWIRRTFLNTLRFALRQCTECLLTENNAFRYEQIQMKREC